MLLPRFLEKVDRRGPRSKYVKGRCWIWLGAKDRAGYPIFQLRTRHTVKAHRLALSDHLGRDLQGDALHKCGNASCVNPSHLQEGNDKENATDRDRHGRTARHEKNGRAALSYEDAVRIRGLHASGLSYRALAKRFGMGKTQIGRIVRREHWVKT